MSAFTRIDSEAIWEGKIITVGIEHFRYADGAEVTREKVWHPGAVAVLAIDHKHVWLTRQPREVVGLSDSLEIPAGKLDVEGEAPLDAAKRELAEEIGQAADEWREITGFFTSAGFSDERIVLYLARGLSESDLTHPAAADEDERIEIVRWPLTELDAAIDGCSDAKSLIALLWLARQLASGQL
jgi:8-oxo-dGTP pyrophosphatase MutT (NUDIX family)